MSIVNPIVTKSINYIIEHLNDEIQVDHVAQYCNFSKFHFNRMFKAETGESIYMFIKRLKLEKSAVLLALETSQSITDVGQKYGYSSSNYSTAFKKHHRQSPAEFRLEKNNNRTDFIHPFLDREVELKPFDYYDSRIEIKEIDDLCVLFERHIGSYKELAHLWDEFIDKYKSMRTKTTMYLEQSHDDPLITEIDRCIFDLCMTIQPEEKIENKMMIKGGKVAVYHFKGQNVDIFEAYKGLFNIWLPISPYRLADRCAFDIYTYTDCSSNYLEMDLCLPIL